MGKIALSQHTSLDGVMQSPGPTDVPFKYRGWIMDFDCGPEGDRFQLEQAQNSEALLLGRVTYEAMQTLGCWECGSLRAPVRRADHFLVGRRPVVRTRADLGPAFWE
jgi:hypothetical protein